MKAPEKNGSIVLKNQCRKCEILLLLHKIYTIALDIVIKEMESTIYCMGFASTGLPALTSPLF